MKPGRALGRPDRQVPGDGKHAHDDELVDDDDDEDDDDHNDYNERTDGCDDDHQQW